MTDTDQQQEKEFHEKVAKETFNLVWDLLDKKDRTKDDELQMIHAAHASRFHWGKIGEPLQFERGEWQISRVYSVLNIPQQALYHAQQCLDICKVNGIADFDIAFAYEALARAYSLIEDSDAYEENLKLAKEAGNQIENDDNKSYFFSELETISKS
jgi:hypothetical protein